MSADEKLAKADKTAAPEKPVLRVLFILPHGIQAASSRYRVYQYLPYLQAHGIQATLRPFVGPRFYRLLYRPGQLLPKTAFTLRSLISRLLDLRLVPRHDLVYLLREAAPLGPPWFERLAAASGVPLVYDFDDAIYLLNVSPANRGISWLKQPGKTAGLVSLSRQVVAGNANLAAYASRFNPRVTILPTPIDTAFYTLKPRTNPGRPVVLGWVGSHSNLPYLRELDPVLQELARRRQFRLRVVGGAYALPGVEVESVPWTLERELEDLHSFDVGLMPMPDNEWTRGKCGFKALQYMGVGLPAVAAPVGVNAEIIRHGENGFLASSRQDWLAALETLVADPQLRQRAGLRGRKTVEESYSLQVHAPRLLQILHEAAA